jgi:glutathione S-transferase
MILHNYALSPFSEKIRAMLGYAELPWQSAISPAMPPRPIVDPLAGGYRKIPVGQIGADIFCDTRIISSEISTLSNKPKLAIENCSEEIQAFVKHVDNELFMAVVANSTPRRALMLLLTNFTPWSALRFIKDRADMGSKSKLKPIRKKQAESMIAAHLSEMESRLEKEQFLFGDAPTIGDFSAYHLLWFREKTSSVSFRKANPAVCRWLQDLKSFGHGKSQRITKSAVFQIAQTSQPRPIPEHLLNSELIGQTVSVGPNDYGLTASSGAVVGADELRLVIARETDKFGTIHVHFPRAGFDITIADN